jgi:hypothetical protein
MPVFTVEKTWDSAFHLLVVSELRVSGFVSKVAAEGSHPKR